MFLIVGLGNPGEKYQNTRHNIGSRIIDELEPLDLKGTILARPTTFMNESGRAVKKLVSKYKIPFSKLIVIHDDIDIPIGKIKISKNSGAGGHKGVESIIENLGTKDFIRLRIGIQPESGKPKRAENFVLKNFSKKEEKILEKVMENVDRTAEIITDGKTELAMTEFNQ
jgi:peptidyl-tRNA hydrolase, PTH1 family